MLTISNPAAGNYTLYSDAQGVNILQQNTTGNFSVADISSDTIFYIRREEGSCSSPLVKVSVKAVDKTYFIIPNAFTPNGDGINDRLPVRVKGYIELNYFRIYSRWGQVLFETKKLNDAWDGTWKGNPQVAGAYVWIAEGKDLLGTIIRDKGNVILIR